MHSVLHVGVIRIIDGFIPLCNLLRKLRYSLFFLVFSAFQTTNSQSQLSSFYSVNAIARLAILSRSVRWIREIIAATGCGSVLGLLIYRLSRGKKSARLFALHPN